MPNDKVYLKRKEVSATDELTTRTTVAPSKNERDLFPISRSPLLPPRYSSVGMKATSEEAKETVDELKREILSCSDASVRDSVQSQNRSFALSSLRRRQLQAVREVGSPVAQGS